MPGIYRIRNDPLHGAGVVREEDASREEAEAGRNKIDAGREKPGVGGAKADAGRENAPELDRRTASLPDQAAGLAGSPEGLSDWSARFLLSDPLDLELVRALRVVSFGCQRVQRLEASTLSWLRETRSYRRLGFSCFGDLARAFQMAPRTAHEHVALHRLLEDRPMAEGAFGRGNLSLHQVLALAPILKRGELDPHWLEVAARVPVAALRTRAREAAKALETQSDEAAGDPQTVFPPHRARIQLDDTLEAALEEVPGRMVSFRAPPSVVLAWDHAMEIGRRVLGWDAPRHACVEAILAEASPETASVPEPPAVEGVGEGRAASGASESDRAEDAANDAGDGAGADAGDGGDAGDGAGAGAARPTGPTLSPALRPPSAVTMPRPASEESQRRARLTLTFLGAHMKELLSLEGIGEKPAEAKAGGSDAQGAAAGAAVGDPPSATAAIGKPPAIGYGSGIPDEARLAARKLRLLRSKARPLRVLFSRLLRDLHNTGAVERLGFASMEQFGQAIGLSGRAVRELRNQAYLFQDHPALERAFSRGRIGSEQARLLSRVVTTRGCGAHIARAEEITSRQLEREVRLLERMNQFDPMLAARFRGPFPHPGMERALKAELIEGGRDDKRIEKELSRRGLKHVVEEAERVGAYLDPACNPIIMRRLEALSEMLVLTRSDGERVRSRESLASAGQADAGRQTSAQTAAAAESGAAAEGGPAPNRQTSAQPAEAGAGEPAPDRQTSAQLDVAVRRALREDNLIPIRFWAPMEIAGHWERAVRAKREEFAVEIPLAAGRSRVEPLPVWAAVLMLMRDALSVWELRDPERIPTQRAVLERDECHCRMPWCTHRRMMEAHHVHYRSRGGSNLMENKEADCHGHHKEIHAGCVRVRGTAPHGLIFELGCHPGLPPWLRMHGEKILEWGW